MAEYIFDGKTFRFPDEPTNERVISVAEAEEKADKAWWLSRTAIPEMMKALLDGPHDEIDWLKQSMPKCLKVYKDFFPHVTEKATESVNS